MVVGILSDILVLEAMLGFAPVIAPITAMSYAMDNAALSIGDVVKVPYATTQTSSTDFNYDAGYNNDSTVLGVHPVTLSKLSYQKFTITDTDATKLTTKSVLNIVRQAGEKLAADVVQSCLETVINDTNFPTSASCAHTSLTSSAAIADLVTQADTALWGSENRNIILTPSAWNKLINNPSLNQAFNYGGAQVVQDDKPAKVSGFNVYKTNISMPNSCKAIVLNPNAILFANGLHKVNPINNQYVTQTTSADKNGLTISMRSWYDANKASTVYVLECLHGVTTGTGTALFQMK